MSRQEPEAVLAAPIAPLFSQFVNRQRELALIKHEYDVASSGSIRVVMLVGELGVGKTRLLNEVSRQVERNGATVLRGDASDAEGMPPYLPFLEALGHYIRITEPEQLREQAAVAPYALLSFLPELAGRLSDLPSSITLPEQGRLRLFEAIGTFLSVISKKYVLVLMLDDLHWADTASFDLLCYITRHQPEARILIIGTYRDGEVEPPLERAMTELIRQRVLTTITVRQLAAKDIEVLAASYLRGALSSNVSDLLYRQCEGNPFFAEEILRVWLETGSLIQENKRWVAAASLEVTLPQSILGALRQRFIRLSTASIDHLRVASIIGRTFSLQLLAAIEDQEAEAVEEHLLEAAHAGLVKSDGKGGFSFTHDKIRESLYIEVSTSRRRRLHEAIGQRLEALYSPDDATQKYLLADLAYHFSRSGDHTRGAHYSQLAAEQAARASALEEAIFHYQTARELLPSGDEKRVPLLLELGEAALQAGMEDKALEAFSAALAYFMPPDLLRSVPVYTDSVRAARAAHGLGLAHWWRGELQEARTALLHALELLEHGETLRIVPVLVDLASVLTLMPDRYKEGHMYAQQALDMAHTLAHKHLETMARQVIVCTLFRAGDELPASIEAIRQALEPALLDGDPGEVARCSAYLSIIHYFIVDMRYALQMALRRKQVLEGYHRPYELRGLYCWMALLYASQGAWQEAEQAIEQEQLMAERRPNVVVAAFLHHVRGFLAYQREDYITADLEFQATEEYQHSGSQLFVSLTGLPGLVQATVGKRKEARVHLMQFDALHALLPAGTIPTAPLLVCQALTTITLGEVERARRFSVLLQPFRGQQYWFLVDRVLGMLARLRGDWESADMYLDAAEVTAQQGDLRPELARTLVLRAEVELARNNQEGSELVKTLLKRALTIFDELGMTHAAEQARVLLRAQTNRSVRTAARVFPAELTEREARVLQLVAQGKSNRQIARALDLSEKTIANHLSHIFSKIGSENRASATAFAIRHGLA